MAVFGEDQVVGSKDDRWGRCDVNEAQKSELHHELFEAQTHGSIGPHASNHKNEKDDKPKPDEDVASDIIEDMVSIVRVSHFGDHRDDDVDDAQRTH